MCLIYPQKLNQTKDVVCYKLFYKYTSTKKNWFIKIINKLFFNKTLLSIFQLTNYKLGKLKSLNVNGPLFSTCNNIHGNSLHSFVNFNDVIDYLKYNYQETDIDEKYILCIVKCIIPKNNNFLYKGTFVNYPSFVSEKLIPKEIIAEWKKIEN